jgi:acyl carrier protein
MQDLNARLVRSFQVVFPNLPEGQIPGASRASLEAWDSVSSVILANVLEEEFGIPADFDRLEDLDSFEAVRNWVESQPRTA